MIIHNFKQGSQEWHDIRKLKMTASHAQAIGNSGKGLETYIYDLCADYLSSAEKEQLDNEHIQRGNELEAQARFVYEAETGNTVQEVGFIEIDDRVGCSPDGLIGEQGLVEIKCPSDREYLKQMVLSSVKSEYVWQIQMQMLLCQRAWCDYVAYNPNFHQPFFIKRIEPCEKKMGSIAAGLGHGKEMIDKILNQYKGVKDAK